MWYVLHFREKDLQELGRKYSDLRRELITVKESLDQITLQKEMLEDDKASLSLALDKVKCCASVNPTLYQRYMCWWLTGL